MMYTSLEQRITALSEKYQPIFGHPEFSDGASRPCDDRLSTVSTVYKIFSNYCGRPLRVLDLGCAQGYFSLHLANLGAEVLGIDASKENIALCDALANEFPALKVQFKHEDIELFFQKTQCNDIDMILGLSVFHHIIYKKGTDVVRNILRKAASQVAFLLLEFAKRQEPLYWGSSQPEDLRELLDDVAFVHEVALHTTHLSAVERPMFFASNFFWILQEHVEKIESWSPISHPFYPADELSWRRYYRSASKFLKWYRLDKRKFNSIEFQTECQFLSHVPDNFFVPSVICFGSNSSEAWVCYDFVDGELVSELIVNSKEIDSKKIILDVLNQSIILESNGYYHNDIRLWNIMAFRDGSFHLIDYGSISKKKEDCEWPFNIYFSFFIFIFEITGKIAGDIHPLRSIALTPGGYPHPYDTLLRKLWEIPLNEWNFGLIKKLFTELDMGMEHAPQLQEAWGTALEQALQTLKLAQKETATQLKALTAQTEGAAQQAQALAVQAEARGTRADAFINQMEHAPQLQEAWGTALEQALQTLKLAQKETATQLKALTAQTEGAAQQAQAQISQAESRIHQLEVQIAQAQALAVQAEARAARADAFINQVEARANQAEDALNVLVNSRSWRMTAPLRCVRRLGVDGCSSVQRWVIRRAASGKAACRFVVVHTIQQVLRRPWLWASAKAMLRKWPWLYGRLARLYWSSILPPMVKEDAPANLRTLPVQVRRIYRDLQAAKAADIEGKK